MFSRVFDRLKKQEAKTACMLPNVARYQLRHTPRMYRIIIADEKIFVKRQAKIRLPLFNIMQPPMLLLHSIMVDQILT